MLQQQRYEQGCISIHSLRMEGDRNRVHRLISSSYFNPLPPHGGRPNEIMTTTDFIENFNPLPPHGGRPANILHDLFPAGISIHSLRMEGDAIRILVQKCQPYFNPLPPHGGRPCSFGAAECAKNFNPLPPHGGRLLSFRAFHRLLHFNPLPPHGGRHPHRIPFPNIVGNFNPLPPHGGRHCASLASTM